ncbi:methyl-accepting chemotaxis protein [Clostridium tagluense]|uniref:methyl-accepting chemotaxis protein n=1 Tax=Clostridium tagluense TaxID=360422 RepID=UPI001C0B7B95|nr:methyl-accepting chemotaxis protein [Clostridium tagluense]MBU3127337.1 methyl-accepting chemotaxis protein [Clostridium tagluense]MCB2311189.1 methyl-accepting chemotaxis protein [Clostridium tagluense]MCB2315913.1 methyl-accepting chemotaxis protein [Clostridium tagluense]MCB2320740.1 methyl-accepting chemotaxis protein [Clostridium tagluense]MCB2325757.1 methyl-accepting chemotaxis protein [Clostridium tagluense]
MKRKTAGFSLLFFLLSATIFNMLFLNLASKSFKTVLSQGNIPAKELEIVSLGINSIYVKYNIGLSLIFSIVLFCIILILIKNMNHSMKTIDNQTKKLAEGQFTVRVKANGVGEVIATNINEIVQNIRKVLCEVMQVSQMNRDLADTLQSSAQQTEATANEISTAILEVAVGATTQAEASISTKENTQQMWKNADKIAKFAENAKDIAKNMIQVIQINTEMFAKFTDKMEDTALSNSKLAHTIQTLQDEIHKINTIIQVVTDISERTNLLALNAAIEAARAGEQGKGFAVVADEVRKLAEQSSSSVGDIGKITTNIIEKISIISIEAKEEVKKIEENVEFVEQAKESFSKVIDSTKLTYDAVDEISILAVETASEAEHVNELMDKVSSITQQSLAITEEVSAAAQEQTTTMHNMSVIVGKMNKTADEIDGQLKNFTNNITLGEKENNIIKEGLEILKSIAIELSSKGYSIEHTSELLKNRKSSYMQFEYIGVIDSEGNMRFATENIIKGSNNYSFRPYFRASVAGKEFRSEPYISNVSYNYCIAISVPFKDNNGKINGVVMADICIVN